MQASWFRQDVYYRLNEFVITLPPLRERDDILDLANGFLVEANMEFGRACREISERAAEVLLRYPWPGNVRELRNVIRRAMLLVSDVIEPDDLAFLSVSASPTIALRGELAPGHSSLKEIAGAAAAAAEQQAIRRALEITMGNKSEAARLLRTDYKTLHLKMKHYGVDARRFREGTRAVTHLYDAWRSASSHRRAFEFPRPTLNYILTSPKLTSTPSTMVPCTLVLLP